MWNRGSDNKSLISHHFTYMSSKPFECTRDRRNIAKIFLTYLLFILVKRMISIAISTNVFNVGRVMHALLEYHVIISECWLKWSNIQPRLYQLTLSLCFFVYILRIFLVGYVICTCISLYTTNEKVFKNNPF